MFKWKKLHDVGVHLEDQSLEEEYQRSAIGRYYYSCYAPVKKHFAKKYEPHTKKTHRLLIQELNIKGNSVEKKISKNLNQLRNYRNNADYDDFFNKRNVKVARILSKEIHDLLKSLKKDN